MAKRVLLAIGIVAGIAMCFLYGMANMKYQNEWITYEPDLKSELENNSACYLCGENSKSLMGYYRKYGDLLVVYLPTWDIWPAHILDEDIDAAGTSTLMGTSRDGIYRYSTEIMKSRGISEISIQIAEKNSNIWDVENLGTMLCSNCISKVAKTLEITSERKDCFPEPFCLVNASDLEVYSLQEQDKTKIIDDYYVSIDFEEDEKNVLAIYAPDCKMTSLLGIQ